MLTWLNHGQNWAYWPSVPTDKYKKVRVEMLTVNLTCMYGRTQSQNQAVLMYYYIIFFITESLELLITSLGHAPPSDDQLPRYAIIVLSTSYNCYVKVKVCLQAYIGRRRGLLVSVLNSGSSGSGLSAGRGHCVVFLENTFKI